MKVGAEPRKVAILAGLIIVAGYLLYNNFASSPVAPAAPRQPAQSRVSSPAPALPETGRPVPRPEIRSSRRAGVQEFRPSLKPRQEGERQDLSSIDPTLRLDLLAKLQKVTVEGGDRSLFEFGAAPLPKNPEPKIIPKKPELAKDAAGENKAEPPKPPPPPIPLKFFGYTIQARQGNKRAFFLDGDEILVASEGEVMKKRYKVKRIGVNSVVVEDLNHQHEQTLPIVAEVG
jgi:hypothetical protein